MNLPWQWAPGQGIHHLATSDDCRHRWFPALLLSLPGCPGPGWPAPWLSQAGWQKEQAAGPSPSQAHHRADCPHCPESRRWIRVADGHPLRTHLMAPAGLADAEHRIRPVAKKWPPGDSGWLCQRPWALPGALKIRTPSRLSLTCFTASKAGLDLLTAKGIKGGQQQFFHFVI